MASFQVESALKQLGHDIRTARKKRRLSVADFCERVGVTDKTLAKLERGDGGVRIETLATALLALGELHRLKELINPADDHTGLVLDAGRLPQRIVSKRRTSRASGGTVSDPVDDEGSAF
ncbi:helix-turn-helix domain-containing protein (plasmid) [Cereibacter azotoformans]|uniref:helix-turn-helix domain-containing protein n=1 Tax=Cereibacter azotoformans TaxID=43057 RepID=UPI0002EF1558|nr:helix-turn-helix transcriptional regulator [Cereibacter azotoformans]UIJ32959.1 helix-turn-helix domain-containing protein [Cereibacter azotoformans]ULB12224.1 helix-turn-helix domain-containing protein [Cereibacter azotoformans]